MIILIKEASGNCFRTTLIVSNNVMSISLYTCPRIIVMYIIMLTFWNKKWSRLPGGWYRSYNPPCNSKECITTCTKIRLLSRDIDRFMTNTIIYMVQYITKVYLDSWSDVSFRLYGQDDYGWLPGMTLISSSYLRKVIPKQLNI